MSKVWDRVVEDLAKYGEPKVVVDKPFWQKVWNFVVPDSNCTHDCNQGRYCRCCGGMHINHDNRY